MVPEISLIIVESWEPKEYCLQMAAEDLEICDELLTLPVSEGSQETSYIFVRSLGSGAFAEANLYRKIDVSGLGATQTRLVLLGCSKFGVTVRNASNLYSRKYS